MTIARLIEVQRDGGLKISGGVGSRNKYPLDYQICQWDVISKHRQRMIDGLTCAQNRNKEFAVAESVTGAKDLEVEISILSCKWETKKKKKRGYGAGSATRMTALAGAGPLFLVELGLQEIVKHLTAWWRVRIVLDQKQLQQSGWKLVDSFETTGGGGEWKLTFDELGHALKNHWGK